MNKLDTHSPLTREAEATSALPAFAPVPVHVADGTPRLIVLMSPEIDARPALPRIRDIARSTGMPICLLGLCRESRDEPALRRRLVGMASLVQGDSTRVDLRVDIGTGWVRAVEGVYQAGDVIVCFAEQRAGLLQRPLDQVLESSFSATVYILTDLTLLASKSGALARIRAWLGFIGIMLGFGLLQASIVRLPASWLQNTLLILSVLPEFWLIWAWNARTE